MNATVNQLLNPKRGADESGARYVKRRAYANGRVKRWLAGTLIWNSDKGGTFRRDKHTLNLTLRGTLLGNWVEREGSVIETLFPGENYGSVP